MPKTSIWVDMSKYRMLRLVYFVFKVCTIIDLSKSLYFQAMLAITMVLGDNFSLISLFVVLEYLNGHTNHFINSFCIATTPIELALQSNMISIGLSPTKAAI